MNSKALAISTDSMPKADAFFNGAFSRNYISPLIHDLSTDHPRFIDDKIAFVVCTHVPAHDQSRFFAVDHLATYLQSVTAKTWRLHHVCLEQFPPSRRAVQKRNLNLSWVVTAVNSDKAESGTDTLEVVIEGLNELLKARQFEDIRRIFRVMPENLISPEIMVTLLRTTFAVRSLIDKPWYSLLRRVRAELNARGLPSKKILIGLEQ